MNRTLEIGILCLLLAAAGGIAAQRFTLTFNQAKLGFVLETLSRKTGVKLITGTELSEKAVSAYLEDVDGEEAIDAILRANGLYREKLGGSNVYVVYQEKQNAESALLQSRYFPLRYAKADDVKKTLTPYLGSGGKITTDHRTNAVIVRDTPENLRQYETVITMIDVDFRQCPVSTRSFKLQYAKPEALCDILVSVLRQRGKKIAYAPWSVEASPVRPGDAEISTTSNIQSSGDGSSSSGSSSGTTGGSSSGGSSSSSSSGAGQSAGTPSVGAGESGSAGQTDQDISIIADTRTSSLIATGTENFLEEVADLIAKLDKPIPQVSIEAILVELTSDGLRDIGIKWNMAGTATGGAMDVKFPFDFSTQNLDRTIVSGLSSTSSTSSTTTSPAQFILGTLDFRQMTAALRFLETKGEAEILANPRITTMNDSKAVIQIVRNTAVANRITFNQQTGAASSSEPIYKDIGISLYATPHINEDGYILLNIMPTVSSAQPSSTFANAVDTDIRSAVTNVLVKNGETIAIGGLLSKQNVRNNYDVPFLGKILPFLFSNKSNQQQRRDLVIFLTPTIIGDEFTRKSGEEKKTKTGAVP